MLYADSEWKQAHGMLSNVQWAPNCFQYILITAWMRWTMGRGRILNSVTLWRKHLLLAFSFLREGLQRIQDLCSSRKKNRTSPLDPPRSFTIWVPICMELMHFSTGGKKRERQTKKMRRGQKVKKKSVGVLCNIKCVYTVCASGLTQNSIPSLITLLCTCTLTGTHKIAKQKPQIHLSLLTGLSFSRGRKRKWVKVHNSKTISPWQVF